VAWLHVCCLAGAVPAVDHFQFGAPLTRVSVAGVGLMVGPLLVVEMAQDRSGVPAALPR
jgi:hypothetical protein